MESILAALDAACDRLNLPAGHKEELRKAVEDATRVLVARNGAMKAILDETARLVKATGHERIIHDLRNVLNELVLLQALAEQSEDAPNR